MAAAATGVVVAAARVGSADAFNNPGLVRAIDGTSDGYVSTSVRYLHGHALHPLYRDGTTNSILPKIGT